MSFAIIKKKKQKQPDKQRDQFIVANRLSQVLLLKVCYVENVSFIHLPTHIHIYVCIYIYINTHTFSHSLSFPTLID